MDGTHKKYISTHTHTPFHIYSKFPACTHVFKNENMWCLSVCMYLWPCISKQRDPLASHRQSFESIAPLRTFPFGRWRPHVTHSCKLVRMKWINNSMHTYSHFTESVFCLLSFTHTATTSWVIPRIAASISFALRFPCRELCRCYKTLRKDESQNLKRGWCRKRKKKRGQPSPLLPSPPFFSPQRRKIPRHLVSMLQDTKNREEEGLLTFKKTLLQFIIPVQEKTPPL